MGRRMLTLAEIERQEILARMRRYDDNVQRVADSLGLSAATVYKKLARYRRELRAAIKRERYKPLPAADFPLEQITRYPT